MPAVPSIATTASPLMLLPSSTKLVEPSTRATANSPRNAAETSDTVFAGLAVLLAMLALIVGLLHLRNERNKDHQARDIQVELAELEAEISERIRERLRRREGTGSRS